MASRIHGRRNPGWLLDQLRGRHRPENRSRAIEDLGDRWSKKEDAWKRVEPISKAMMIAAEMPPGAARNPRPVSMNITERRPTSRECLGAAVQRVGGMEQKD